jgi:hypothetical protein
MVELLSVLALATNQIKQGRFSKCAGTYTFPVAQCFSEKFAKKLLGEKEIEAVLQRLDRLTQDEARMTVTQTLGVVHSLVGNMKVVMEGAECLHDCLQEFSEGLFCLDGKASTGSIRQDLGKHLTRNRCYPC